MVSGEMGFCIFTLILLSAGSFLSHDIEYAARDVPYAHGNSNPTEVESMSHRWWFLQLAFTIVPILCLWQFSLFISLNLVICYWSRHSQPHDKGGGYCQWLFAQMLKDDILLTDIRLAGKEALPWSHAGRVQP